MWYLAVTLTTRGWELHNLELLPCTVTGSWIDLDLRLKLNNDFRCQHSYINIKYEYKQFKVLLNLRTFSYLKLKFQEHNSKKVHSFCVTFYLDQFILIVLLMIPGFAETAFLFLIHLAPKCISHLFKIPSKFLIPRTCEFKSIKLMQILTDFKSSEDIHNPKLRNRFIGNYPEV